MLQGIVLARPGWLVGDESFLEGCLGNFVVRLYLLGVLQRVRDHVEAILSQTWLRPLPRSLVFGVFEDGGWPRGQVLVLELVRGDI